MPVIPACRSWKQHQKIIFRNTANRSHPGLKETLSSFDQSKCEFKNCIFFSSHIIDIATKNKLVHWQENVALCCLRNRRQYLPKLFMKHSTDLLKMKAQVCVLTYQLCSWSDWGTRHSQQQLFHTHTSTHAVPYTSPVPLWDVILLPGLFLNKHSSTSESGRGVTGEPKPGYLLKGFNPRYSLCSQFCFRTVS